MTQTRFELKPYLTRKQDLVNECLKKILNQCSRNRELVKAMAHSLMAGGKRLRPILAIAAAQACGRDYMPALPAACAIEMIHTYSLIHDDLPAMDDDDLRRGLPTCHKMFSEATAILAGDALLTHAFYILSSPESVFEIYPDAETRIKLVSKIAAAAGVNGMVEGQMMDMQVHVPGFNEDRLACLKKLHSLKTGRMIRTSLESGAISAGALPEQIEILVNYADRIGLAFQVVDDILNIEGNPEIMGKAAGSDIENDKLTFPSLIGLDASKKFAADLAAEAIDYVSFFEGEAAGPLIAIAEYIVKRDH